jgi:hypothetical protein
MGKVLISIILLIIESYHDSIREKLEVGSYDEKIDYKSKIVKGLGLLTALFYFYIATGDFLFPAIYITLRILLFDIFYYYFSGRKITKEYLINNFWVIRLYKIWRK